MAKKKFKRVVKKFLYSPTMYFFILFFLDEFEQCTTSKPDLILQGLCSFRGGRIHFCFSFEIFFIKPRLTEFDLNTELPSFMAKTSLLPSPQPEGQCTPGTLTLFLGGAMVWFWIFFLFCGFFFPKDMKQYLVCSHRGTTNLQ